jgi:hypothetical protein
MSLQELAFRARLSANASGVTIALRLCSNLALCKRLMDGLKPRPCGHEVQFTVKGELNLDDVIEHIRGMVSWKMTQVIEVQLRSLICGCCLEYVEAQMEVKAKVSAGKHEHFPSLRCVH